MEDEVKTDNRKVILDCALDLFYSKGYDAVGVQEIVKAAGITKPTMYYYFKSKHGLLTALLEENCTILNQSLKTAASYYTESGDLTITLQKICKVYLTMAHLNRKFYYFMIALFYSAKENDAYKAIKPYMVEHFHIIKELFISAENVLGNMNGRQEQFAIGLTGILNHYILVYYESDIQTTLLNGDDSVRSIVHQFMHGINS